MTWVKSTDCPPKDQVLIPSNYTVVQQSVIPVPEIKYPLLVSEVVACILYTGILAGKTSIHIKVSKNLKRILINK